MRANISLVHAHEQAYRKCTRWHARTHARKYTLTLPNLHHCVTHWAAEVALSDRCHCQFPRCRQRIHLAASSHRSSTAVDCVDPFSVGVAAPAAAR